MNATIDTATEKLKKSYFCEYTEYGVDECGKPATHAYLPVPYCGYSFVCKKHAEVVKKQGYKNKKISKSDRASG